MLMDELFEDLCEFRQIGRPKIRPILLAASAHRSNARTYLKQRELPLKVKHLEDLSRS